MCSWDHHLPFHCFILVAWWRCLQRETKVLSNVSSGAFIRSWVTLRLFPGLENLRSLHYTENWMSHSPSFSSVTQSCPTLCDPMDCSTPGLPVLHHLLEFAQTHVHLVGDVSNHLILCHPLLLLPSLFASIRVFSNESVLHIRWLQYWNFSFSIILPMNIQNWTNFL